MSTPREYNNVRNLEIEDRGDQREYLEYLDEQLDERHVERQEFISGTQIQDGAEAYPERGMVYELVDAMAIHDDARRAGQDEFADHLQEQVDRFLWEVERDYRRTFEQVSLGPDTAQDYIRDIVETNYAISDEAHDTAVEKMEAERVDERSIELAELDHQIQQTEDPVELCERLDEYAALYQDVIEDDEHRPRSSYVPGSGAKPHLQHDLVDQTGGELGADQMEAGVYAALQHRLFMRVAPLGEDGTYLSDG